MKKLLPFFLFLTVSLFSLISPVSAYEEEKAYVLQKDEIASEDLIVAANKVKIYGTVKGDLYTAAESVLIEGVVEGDVLVAAGTVEISGKVMGSVRVISGDIALSGEIGKNLSVAAGNFTVTSTGTVSGSLVAGAGTVVVDGQISEKSNIAAGTVSISDKFGSDLNLGAGTIFLKPGAEINGNLDYWSDNQADISDQASVSGQVRKHDPTFSPETILNDSTKEKFSSASKTFSFVGKLIWLASAFFVGFIFINLFPKLNKKALDVLTTSSLKSVGYGFLALFAIPIIFFFLLLTLIGAPFSFIVLAFYFIYLYLAKIVVSLWVGKFIAKKADFKVNDLGALALGLAIYAVLSLLPFFGGLIKLTAIAAGFGALVLASKQSLPRLGKAS
jgi:cytoskeletal protein CcmA (bactofilin family)